MRDAAVVEMRVIATFDVSRLLFVGVRLRVCAELGCCCRLLSRLLGVRNAD